MENTVFVNQLKKLKWWFYLNDILSTVTRCFHFYINAKIYPFPGHLKTMEQHALFSVLYYVNLQGLYISENSRDFRCFSTRNFSKYWSLNLRIDFSPINKTNCSLRKSLVNGPRKFLKRANPDFLKSIEEFMNHCKKKKIVFK